MDTQASIHGLHLLALLRLPEDDAVSLAFELRLVEAEHNVSNKRALGEIYAASAVTISEKPRSLCVYLVIVMDAVAQGHTYSGAVTYLNRTYSKG